MTTGPDYDAPGVAAAYRDARALAPATARLWSDAIHDAVSGLTVSLAIDVGAGTGRFTRVLAEAVGVPLVAIERSVGMIGQRDVTDARVARFVCATAEAVPLRSAVADVALVSMAYHQFSDRPRAAAELRRVLRPGGRVLVRTPARETLDEFEWLRFFPEALAMERERIPARDAIVREFVNAGFTTRSHAVVRQVSAASGQACLDRVRQRAFSPLRMIPDDVFAAGLANFDAHCRALARPGPVEEPLDLFVFDAVR